VVGCSKNTVKRAVQSDGPTRYERAPSGSVVNSAEPRIRELLAAYPRMPATVIAERIGWDRGMTVLKARVRELRPVYLPPAPASRTSYDPGEIAQHDLWFPDIALPVGYGQVRTATQQPVLVMVTGYARWLSRGCCAPPMRGGPARRLVAAAGRARRGAAGAGVGRGGRGRETPPAVVCSPTPPTPSRHPRRPGADLQSPGSGHGHRVRPPAQHRRPAARGCHGSRRSGNAAGAAAASPPAGAPSRPGHAPTAGARPDTLGSPTGRLATRARPRRRRSLPSTRVPPRALRGPSRARAKRSRESPGASTTWSG
jgi:hypothetical protein